MPTELVRNLVDPKDGISVNMLRLWNVHSCPERVGNPRTIKRAFDMNMVSGARFINVVGFTSEVNAVETNRRIITPPLVPNETEPLIVACYRNAFLLGTPPSPADQVLMDKFDLSAKLPRLPKEQRIYSCQTDGNFHSR
jgi:hypothetical protein